MCLPVLGLNLQEEPSRASSESPVGCGHREKGEEDGSRQISGSFSPSTSSRAGSGIDQVTMKVRPQFWAVSVHGMSRFMALLCLLLASRVAELTPPPSTQSPVGAQTPPDIVHWKNGMVTESPQYAFTSYLSRTEMRPCCRDHGDMTSLGGGRGSNSTKMLIQTTLQKLLLWRNWSSRH